MTPRRTRVGLVGRASDNRAPLRVPAAIRFWTKVQKRPGRKACWEWLGALIDGGYGRFRVDDTHELAHRAAYMLLVGPIPKYHYVLHRCDNKRCVRPAHLYAGTSLENVRDATRRRRYQGPKPLAKVAR